MQALNRTRNTVLANNVRVARSFTEKFIGLLKHKNLPRGEALVIEHCQSIHMFFMRFAIDAVFIDKKGIVVGLIKTIKPFRLSPIFFKARDVIELPAGTILSSKTELGDEIQIQK